MILLWLAAHPLAALAILLTWTVAWVTGAALWGRAIGRDESYSEGYEDGKRDAARQVAHTTAVIPPAPLPLPAGPIDPHLAADAFVDPPPRPPTAEADERVAGPATSAALYCAAELNHLLQAIPEDWRQPR